MRLGMGEAAVILVITLLIFGPKQLPKVTEALRESLAKLRGDEDLT